MTLLAKALYDNLADAPDELSFRKGDIVTVIEQDVDGLVGWWLCLLHGRQGIVPGNRVKVIPPVELDEFEKDSKKRSSYETDEFSDGVDFADGAGHNYDVLPAPVKANTSIQSPLSIKDMFDIPYKNDKNVLGEVYDVPKAQSNEELYDKPKNITSPVQEIYDFPRPASAQEIYDVPKSNETTSTTQTLYDVPTQSSIAAQQSLLSPDNQELYDVPNKTGSVLDMEKLMGEIYDSPFNADTNVNTIKRSPLNSKNSTPRNSMNSPANFVQHKRQSQELYDVPKRASAEIYDTPNSVGGNTTSLSTMSATETYDAPKVNKDGFKTVFQEVYDVPISNTLKRPTPANKPMPPNSQTLPKGFSPRNAQPVRSTRLQEIYDIPTTALNRSSPSTPVLERKLLDDVYDSPKSVDVRTSTPQDGNSLMQTPEIYDVPPPSNVEATQEIYDTPKNNTISRDEIYDVPSSHNLNDVMADVTPAYSPRRRGNRQNDTFLPVGSLEDDYVDYHDIWSKEPPKDLLRAHTQGVSAKELSPPVSPGDAAKKRFSGEHKKSILDQINFEAVKELQMTTNEAADRLSKLHLAVDTCVTTLIAYCRENWLDISVLKTTIQPIRDFSGKLKTALRLLTEFGLGTLVNTTKNINGEILMDKLIGEVEPLLESYYKVKICLMHLDTNNWSVPDIRQSSNEKFFATLNAIMILSQRIPDQCRGFSLSVQNNLNELFQPSPVEAITKQVGALSTETRTSSLKPIVSEQREPSLEDLRRETAGRRQQARDTGTATLQRPVPRLPPKPTLPNQRRSLAGVIEPPESPRFSLANRGFGHIERLVTDYVPENSRQKKYASDPATPSYADGQKTMWGGSCPILLDRNSAAAYSPLRTTESMSSSSSVGASIPEENIEIKQTNTEQFGRNYPSDSNILSPVLTPLHTRSASLPWDDRLKNAFAYDDTGPKSPPLSPLDHRDIESLEFFCRQVESQVMLLRESMKNLTEAVENRDEPVVFVSHSKFIILTAHKVVHGGQEILGRLKNPEIKMKLKNGSAHLTVCIRGVVASTKTAALEYPEPSAMMEMISSVLALGDAVRILHSECRRALNS